MKKMLILLLLLSLLTGLIGCRGEKLSEETGGSQQSDSVTDNGATERPKLTYWFGLSSFLRDQVTNFGETPLGLQIQENAGVDIEFIHPAGDSDDEIKNSLNLLIASGKFPDIIEYKFFDHYQGGPERALADGFLMDLTELIPEQAPDLFTYLKNNPDIDKAVKTDSGKYYTFPFLRGSEIQTVFFGPIVRTDYLEKLGLDEPETIEDWYGMLKAFKEELDIPAPLTYESWMNNETLGVMMGAYKTANDFFIDDTGVVKYGPATDEYKEFLTEFNKWYREGLLDVDIASLDRKQVEAKVVNGDAGASIGYSGSRLGSWLRATEESNPEFNMVGVTYPVLNKGEKPFYGHRSRMYPGYGAALTTQCSNVEAAMRLLNYGYTNEGHMLFDYGTEGITYDMKDGKPYYTDKYSDSDNRFRDLYVRTTSCGPFIQGPFHNFGYEYLPQQKESIEKWNYSNVGQHMLPFVAPLEDEIDEYAMLFNQINSYREEMFYKFLFGQESLDNFQEYVSNMEQMGLQKVIQIKQDAVDRYNNR